jgi:thymidylate synthase ThyX
MHSEESPGVMPEDGPTRKERQPSVQGERNLPLRWSDRAMYIAAPQESVGSDGVVPSVSLVSMTPDPLGTIASVLAMADGRVINELSELSDDDRRHYWEQSNLTHLKAAWEFVEFHFMFDGVPRWWTQQLERQRTATYFEQSLRFAVVEDLPTAVSLPPSLYGTAGTDDENAYFAQETKQAMRRHWDRAIHAISHTYEDLINMGMPAEDARGLLPLGTCTRVHYRTNLRSLAEHAGNRLCTQAQFLWRIVFSKIVESIREYEPDAAWKEGDMGFGASSVQWQFRTIADSEIFRPVCYQKGSCPWGADFDRGCKIRGRVEENAAMGRPSSEWHDPDAINGIPSIGNEEWLLDPTAARFKP